MEIYNRHSTRCHWEGILILKNLVHKNDEHDITNLMTFTGLRAGQKAIMEEPYRHIFVIG